MADAYPKKILPYLEGRIGDLRIMRFWSKVDIGSLDECWLWRDGCNPNGYGKFKLASYQIVTASRLALIISAREEPHGLHVLHRCDNPPCCNPAHLYFGTRSQNMQDKVQRGRAYSGNQSGASNGAAKLTEDHVALIVSRMRQGWTNTRIASDLPVTHAGVSLIRRGRSWRSVTDRLGWEPSAGASQ